MVKIFEKTYDGESVVDVYRDVSECFSEDFNPAMKTVPQDQWGFSTGLFRVTFEWIPE